MTGPNCKLRVANGAGAILFDAIEEGGISPWWAPVARASAEWRDRQESKVGLFHVRCIHGYNSHEKGEPACAA
jgi:hypothetical protein